jgi:hypothetical protein
MWHRALRSQAKIAVGVLLLLLLLGGGWYTADRLTRAEASVSSTDAVVLETTVKKVVTVRERGRKSASGTIRVAPRLVTTVVKKQLVTVNGKTATVVRTQLVPTTRVETRTQTRAVTSLRTITDQQTITNNRTLTQTQTLPALTVTQTQTLTLAQAQIKAVTQTVTVTVTVTVTKPPPKDGGG